MLTKPYFFRLVKRAYTCRHSAEHERIMSRARKWYGMDRVAARSRFLSNWFMDFIVQAQYGIFHSGASNAIELGTAGIGVGDLRIHCSTGDINSSLVYLIGFSDNLTFFRIYRLFASPGSTAVDVGANLGIHTLALSDCVSHGKVLSFEPRRSVYPKLIDNVNENGITNVVASDKALGDSVGGGRLHVEENDFNIGKARLSDQGNQAVDVTTLDHALKGSTSAVSLIKIDTEGHELHVLRGAACLLADHKPVLVCEYSPASYSFDQLKSLIPYRARYYKVPYNQYEKLERIQTCTLHPCDLLIVPEEKLNRETWDQFDSL